RRVHRRHLPPTLELLAVDHALRAKVEDIFGFRFIRYDGDGVGTGRSDKLNAEYAQAAGSTPYQYIVAGFERVWRMAKQHALGRRECKRVTGRLFPGEMVCLGHELARLHAAELRE